MNYDQMMQEQIQNLKGLPKLLLHVCCAPCSSAVLERLSEQFAITCFFYNPNITDEKEYQKRFLELKRFVQRIDGKTPISVLEGDYEPQEFLSLSKGLEHEPERGRRCYLCYELRMRKTAEAASVLNYDYFATTLTLSPYKNSNAINEIGKQLAQKYQPIYLYSDFKKRNGYKRSLELSQKYDLYRQNYCGCIYSKLERESQIKSNNI